MERSSSEYGLEICGNVWTLEAVLQVVERLPTSLEDSGRFSTNLALDFLLRARLLE